MLSLVLVFHLHWLIASANRTHLNITSAFSALDKAHPFVTVCNPRLTRIWAARLVACAPIDRKHLALVAVHGLTALGYSLTYGLPGAMRDTRRTRTPSAAMACA